jgi:UDP-N-acetylglucosamine--N-acetylmuramyl-(pentapeptide) pyrophosphoryl-undecaprenol N-acetylglucosamine transferase
MEFAHNMHELIAAADLSVSRAGGGIFELAACGVPMILVPLPNAKDDHQMHNARAAEAGGAARVIVNSELTAATMVKCVHAFLRDRDCRMTMAQRSRAFAIPDAAARVCVVVEELTSFRRGRATPDH